MKLSINYLLIAAALFLPLSLLSSSPLYAETYSYSGNTYKVDSKWWYFVETFDNPGGTLELLRLGRAKEAYNIGLYSLKESPTSTPELVANSSVRQIVQIANVLLKENVYNNGSYVGSATEYVYTPEITIEGFLDTNRRSYDCDLDDNLRCTLTSPNDTSNPKATLGPFTLTSKFQSIFDSQEFVNLSTDEKLEVICFIVDAADTTCSGPGKIVYLSYRNMLDAVYERNEFPYAGTDTVLWEYLVDTNNEAVSHRPTSFSDKEIVFDSGGPFHLYMYDNIADACNRQIDNMPNFTAECTDKLKKLDGKAPSGSGSSGSSDSDSADSSIGFGCTASVTGSSSLDIIILAFVVAVYYLYRIRRYPSNQ